MAFTSLDAIRTTGLNLELGLIADTDVESFGTTDQRNFYLQRAFAKLWPEMARLRREDVSTVASQTDYTLTNVRDIVRIMVLDAAGLEQSNIKSWDLWEDEAADPVVRRLRLPLMEGGLTLQVLGYAPYIVPATGATLCDLPPRLEYVVCAGARVEAYRAKTGPYANFKNFQSENRINTITAAEILDLLRSSEREFGQYRADNRRELTGTKRAIRTVR